MKDDDAESKMSVPYVPAYKPPDIQKPFQPGMSPEHLDERYMVKKIFILNWDCLWFYTFSYKKKV